MNKREWITQCYHWKSKWSVISEKSFEHSKTGVDIYAIIDAVNQYSNSNDIIMGDAGSISYVGPVALKSKKGQRLIFSPAQADMGWAIPGAIGVAMASRQPVIAIVGDGSFMSNIQELAVIKEHNLNVKFIILNNSGYLSIKNTQNKFFEGRVYGTSSKTGLWFPSFYDVAKTFGMKYDFIENINSLDKLDTIFRVKGPTIINIFCKEDQEILPAQAFKTINGRNVQCGLDDMYPFLSEEEMAKERVV